MSAGRPSTYLLFGLLASLLLAGLPAAQAAPERAWHMVVIPAEADAPAMQAWLAQRGAASPVAEVVLAAELSEADVQAVAEREDVIQVRAPQPGEPVERQWVPVAGGGK